MRQNKIAALVPAFNEAERIPAVLAVLAQFPRLDEIIVIDDGSTDNTSKIVSQTFPLIRLITKSVNRGKGAAMKIGFEATDADILLFIDADLVGLTHDHLNDMLIPLEKGTADMTVGMFSSGRFQTDLSHKMFPFVSGQRGVVRAFAQGLPDLSKSRYGVEYILSKYAKEINALVVEIPLLNATHIMKEEKLGFGRGFWARLKMYRDIGMAMTRHRVRKVRNLLPAKAGSGD